jgi:chromosome segregation ATPase
VTKEITDQIEALEREIEELVQRILTLQATCEMRGGEIDRKTRECAEVVGRVAVLQKRGKERQLQIEETQSECERLKVETDRLNLKIQGMAAEEAKVRMRLEMEIAIQEEQIAELQGIERKEREVLDGLVRRQHDLEEVILPQFEYEVGKRAEEIKFQMALASQQKAAVELATIGAMSTGMQELIGEERDREGLAAAMKRIGIWL